MLTSTFDLIWSPGKNSASTDALSKPDIGPVSKPTARKARMK